MKKSICAAFSLIPAVFSLAGCSDKNAYIVPEGNCIVSVPENFLLGAPVNSDTECTKIETKIEGVGKTAGRDYYSVTKGAPLEIMRDFSWFDYDEEGKYGSGKVLTGYTVGEEKITFKLYDADINISCTENCDIEPIYDNFITVGLLYFAESDEETLSIDYLYEAKHFFNDDGSIKQADGLYYVYLKDEFGDMPDCWNTNLTVKRFDCTSRDGRVVEAKFTADRIANKLAACSVCRYESGGYFISSVTVGSICGATMCVGENILNIEFI